MADTRTPARNGTRNMSRTQSGLKYSRTFPENASILIPRSRSAKWLNTDAKITAPAPRYRRWELLFRMGARIRLPGELFILGATRALQVPVFDLEARHVLRERASLSVRQPCESGHPEFRLQATGQNPLRIWGREIVVKPFLTSQRADAIERGRRYRLKRTTQRPQ